MKTQSKVTLASIASEARISTSAVSRILNNRMAHQFSEETRKKVFKIAKRVDYRRNMAARGMAHRHTSTQTHSLLFINSGPFYRNKREDPNHFFFQVLNGVMHEAKRYQFLVSLVAEHETAKDQTEVLSRITSGQAEGVLLTGTILPAVSAYILEHKIPAVYIGDSYSPTGIASVQGDNLNGGLIAARHLIGLGHRRVAFVGDPHDPARQYFSQRLAGFTLGLQEGGLSLDHALAIVSFRRGLNEEMACVMSRSLPPTAFFGGVQNDAMKVLDWLREHGIAVPGQISVMGFDNFPASETSQPKLTVIDVPREAIGSTAVRLLATAIANPGATPVTALVPVSLIVRESTGACTSR
jgi:DNA-binding LacI/PurR family transcriptional regulator